LVTLDCFADARSDGFGSMTSEGQLEGLSGATFLV
jgi:hypothetical protein